MLTTGRIAGISGTVHGLIANADGKRWRAAFVAGLILALLIAKLVGFTLAMSHLPASWIVTAGAGLRVASERAWAVAAPPATGCVESRDCRCARSPRRCCGLLVAGMVSPTKVLGFLDVLGDRDPSLAVVMAAAVTVTRTGFEIARRRGRPFLAEKCHWPTKTGSMHRSCSAP
jgi:uncharacterized membrane protein AbrB (regulator of aidB expression)